MKSGVSLIAAERKRQITKEKFSTKHDDDHRNYELSRAACCYANMGSGGPFSHSDAGRPPEQWPWDSKCWKPSKNIITNLVKAGALIAAEIDRVNRWCEKNKKEKK
jgi:hypothetical protein